MRSPLRSLVSKAPVPYVSSAARNIFSFGTQDPVANMTHQMRSMGSVGTLFAIVNATSEGTSLVDWKLWRKSASGRPEDRIEVTRHLALQIWNKPNPFYTQQELIESFQQHIDLTGEGYLLVSRDVRSSLPLELWPVRPDRMEPVPSPVDYLTGYVYTGPEGERVPLDLNEVIQFRMPNPLDPYRGMGPVQSILVDLDSSKYSAEWNRNFFMNSAEPGGIIEVPDSLSDTEFNELRERWNEQHRGVAQSHRVAILEHGKWVDRKFSQKDMQFAELRGVNGEIIREAFRFPKAMLGTVDDVNLANAKANEVVFARWLIKPRLERIKQALNNDFLPMFGSNDLEFDYCNPVPDDEELEAKILTAQSKAAKELREAGWYPDDILSAVGLPAMRYETPAIQPTPVGGAA